MFDKFITELEKHHPVKVAYKDESWLMHFLFFFARLFNPNFMKYYVTTFGNTMYYPNKAYIEVNHERAISIAAHEYVHMMQQKQYGWWYLFSYALPQILALLSLLTIPLVFVSWWGLLPLLFLVFLLPLPAYWRMKWEKEAYVMSLFVQFYFARKKTNYIGQIVDYLKDQSVRMSLQFSGWSYYKMWPWGVRKDLDDEITKIVSGDICDTNEVFVLIKEILDKTTT